MITTVFKINFVKIKQPNVFIRTFRKDSKSIDGISFGTSSTVIHVHTRTLMTLFTFRLPFFTNYFIDLCMSHSFVSLKLKFFFF